MGLLSIGLAGSAPLFGRRMLSGTSPSHSPTSSARSKSSQTHAGRSSGRTAISPARLPSRPG
eukprot:1926546-Lingulodinium_polyedra.AAC.1